MPDPLSVLPLPDGDYLALWQDPIRTRAEIARHSEADARALPAFRDDCERVCALLERLVTSTRVPDTKGVRAAFSAEGHAPLFDAFVAGSVADLLDARFESPVVKAALGFTSTFGTNAGPGAAGTAYVLMHHLFGATTGIRGQAGYVRGGMGALANALAASAEHAGVTIQTDACVHEIIVESGQARGVRLVDGTMIRGRAVVANCDPHTTFLRLLSADQCPQGIREVLGETQVNGVALKVNCALSALPRFNAIPETLQPARVTLCPSLDYVESAWSHAAVGHPSPEPLLTTPRFTPR